MPRVLVRVGSVDEEESGMASLPKIPCGGIGKMLPNSPFNWRALELTADDTPSDEVPVVLGQRRGAGWVRDEILRKVDGVNHCVVEGLGHLTSRVAHERSDLENFGGLLRDQYSQEREELVHRERTLLILRH